MALIELTADMTAQEQRETINANESFVERAGGWTPVNETLTYSAADAPSYTVTVPGDLTGTLYAGVKIKLTHAAATKYFIVTASAYSGVVGTTLTLYGGTDYTLADTAITAVYYSTAKAPAGFPLDPAKWSVTLSISAGSQTNPGTTNYYNSGSNSITLPIGIWRVPYFAHAKINNVGTGGDAIMTVHLSDLSSALSNSNVLLTFGIPIDYYFEHSGGGELYFNIAAKTAKYILLHAVAIGASESAVIEIFNDGFIRAVCAYL